MTNKPLDEMIEVNMPSPDFYPGSDIKGKMTRGEFLAYRTITGVTAILLTSILAGYLAYSWCQDGFQLPSYTAIRGAIAP